MEGLQFPGNQSESKKRGGGSGKGRWHSQQCKPKAHGFRCGVTLQGVGLGYGTITSRAAG